MYDRKLERPPVVVRYSARGKTRWHRTRGRTHGGDAFPARSTREIPPQQKSRYRQRCWNVYSCRSVQSLPGSVPSGPHDVLIREPLYQEDTCYRSEHTTSHQKQSRISELNPIWNDKKTLLADTAISLKDKQNIVLRKARTGTELVLFNDGRVGDVATGIGGTLMLPPLNIDDVNPKSRDFRGF